MGSKFRVFWFFEALFVISCESYSFAGFVDWKQYCIVFNSLLTVHIYYFPPAHFLPAYKFLRTKVFA